MSGNDLSMMTEVLPVVVLLSLGIITALISQWLRLSPIVGYITLGIAIRASRVSIPFNAGTLATLAELGVVFLLFDVGLNFSLKRIRDRASDIFAFGPAQMLFATIPLYLFCWALGLKPLSALLVAVVLSMSSTAVVMRLIAERHQQNCPVALTATAILIFQDVAAILILVLTGSLEKGGDAATLALFAIVKAAIAFAITVVVARLLIKPVLRHIVRNGHEEVFTAVALLIALAAGWATGRIGLSVTLGAFLGGMSIAESPYHMLIHSEISSFRGLLLGFFFVFVGFSLSTDALLHHWAAILGVTAGFLLLKTATNLAASRTFRWSVPGSIQLGFLLAQGSEFGFVIFTLPEVSHRIGETPASILLAAVSLSLAIGPPLAALGRILAGRLRRQAELATHPELIPTARTAPAVIIGMGRLGRTVADALMEFHIEYLAIEKNQRRLQEAVADGYQVTFGDAEDTRLWSQIAMSQRRLVVIAGLEVGSLLTLTAGMAARYRHLKLIAAVGTESEAEAMLASGAQIVIEREVPRGARLAAAALAALGRSTSDVANWRGRLNESLGIGESLAPSAAA